MPFYTVVNEHTGDEDTVMMSYEAFKEYLVDNPHLKQVFVNPLAICQSQRVGVRKNSQMFRDRMAEIQKAHPKGKIEY